MMGSADRPHPAARAEATPTWKCRELRQPTTQERIHEEDGRICPQEVQAEQTVTLKLDQAKRLKELEKENAKRIGIHE